MKFNTTFTTVRMMNRFLLLTLWLAVANLVHAEQGADLNRGAQAWANTCSRCHNMRQASEFRDDLWRPIINHMRIRAGIPGDMARDIRAFLQASNFAAPARKTSVSTGLGGEQIYSTTCVACHGSDGKGVLPGVPVLADRLANSDDKTLLSHIVNGFQSPGSVMAMPPRGGNSNLSDEDLAAVLGYIRRTFGR